MDEEDAGISDGSSESVLITTMIVMRVTNKTFASYTLH